MLICLHWLAVEQVQMQAACLSYKDNVVVACRLKTTQSVHHKAGIVKRVGAAH